MSIRMSTIKLASNAWSLQENDARLAANQSTRIIVAI